MKAMLVCLCTLLCLSAASQKLTIEINGLRNNKGSILLSVYRDQESFQHEEPFRSYTFSKDNIQAGQLFLTITNLEEGTWGIALIDDENANQQLDFHLFIPSEGFSFSNMPFKEKRKPDFTSFSFVLDESGCHIIFDVFYFSGKEKTKHRVKE
ncbi:MAG: DUF2141 domain-containing protein [Prolixibacteraceae bacterium]|nr:DUF2141 domain-containing protein [Prolixibacteraceae bacterium]